MTNLNAATNLAIEEMHVNGRYVEVKDTYVVIGRETPTGKLSKRTCGWEMYNELEDVMHSSEEFNRLCIGIHDTHIRIYF